MEISEKVKMVRQKMYELAFKTPSNQLSISAYFDNISELNHLNTMLTGLLEKENSEKSEIENILSKMERILEEC